MLKFFWRSAAALLALLALLVPGIARAESHEEGDEWVVKWSNGFKVEKGSDFKLKFGGRLQADFTFADPDDQLEAAFPGEIEDGFEFRRARLFFEGTIYERVKFKAQYEFAGGDPDFKDVWIGLELSRAALIFGHIKEPFSLSEITSAKYLAFLERASPTEAFVPSRNSGITLSGSSGDSYNWGVGVYYDADDFGESLDQDRVNLTGRFVYRPQWEEGGKRMIHLGLSATSKQIETGGTLRFRARPGAHLGPRLADTGGIAADDALGVAVELATVQGPFWAQAEYYNYDVSSPGGASVPAARRDPTLDGFYVQGGYYLTGEHRRYKTSSGAFDRQKPKSNWDGRGGKGAWEIALRYATVDLSEAVPGQELENITVGLNWYLNPATRFMLNLVQAETELQGDANYVLFRWQVDF